MHPVGCIGPPVQICCLIHLAFEHQLLGSQVEYRTPPARVPGCTLRHVGLGCLDPVHIERGPVGKRVGLILGHTLVRQALEKRLCCRIVPSVYVRQGIKLERPFAQWHGNGRASLSRCTQAPPTRVPGQLVQASFRCRQNQSSQRPHPLNIGPQLRVYIRHHHEKQQQTPEHSCHQKTEIPEPIPSLGHCTNRWPPAQLVPTVATSGLGPPHSHQERAGWPLVAAISCPASCRRSTVLVRAEVP